MRGAPVSSNHDPIVVTECAPSYFATDSVCDASFADVRLLNLLLMVEPSRSRLANNGPIWRLRGNAMRMAKNFAACPIRIAGDGTRCGPIRLPAVFRHLAQRCTAHLQEFLGDQMRYSIVAAHDGILSPSAKGFAIAWLRGASWCSGQSLA